MISPLVNRRGRVVGHITHSGGPYKAGDPPPSGYLDWHEWAAVQHKAGLRQRLCVRCDRYRYPQEMATGGRSPVCNGCSKG